MYRIFLVEDDAVIAAAVKRHLEGWGCEVYKEEYQDVKKEAKIDIK